MWVTFHQLVIPGLVSVKGGEKKTQSHFHPGVLPARHRSPVGVILSMKGAVMMSHRSVLTVESAQPHSFVHVFSNLLQSQTRCQSSLVGVND